MHFITEMYKAKDYYHYDIFCANLSLGARIGELLGLKWSDVDFEKKTIHIQKFPQFNIEKKHN